MNYFVTSNLQFGRPFVIENYKRPFSTVEEMNKTLIENWNANVGNNDIVFHLGNFAWDPKTAQEILSNLNGKIYLLPAEFDQSIEELKQKSLLPNHVNLMNRILPIHNKEICLSYWPLMIWPCSEKGYYSFIGYPVSDYKTDLNKGIINVCADFWQYKPVEVDKTKKLFEDLS